MAATSPPLSPNGVVTTGKKMVHRVVLTGGPCAGKTTALARIRTFFENMGWKVFLVPEAATILFGGGIKWSELSQEQADSFQTNIIKTILQIEEVFFDVADKEVVHNCLVVCDRGAMDPSAFLTQEKWQETMTANNWNPIMLRDERYDQIIHMVTAAKGAEKFYQVDNNAVRSEGIEEAIYRDSRAAQAWTGHPYCDTIDNSTDFDTKVLRVVQVICKRLGNTLDINVDDALRALSRKRKFLVKQLPPAKTFGPRYQDFHVQHDYLTSTDPNKQSRVRKRGQNSLYTYTLTERFKSNGKKMDVFRQIRKREYEMLLGQADPKNYSVVKTRRCFHWQNHFFQLDIYKEPQIGLCKDLYLLETYTTDRSEDIKLPDFLDIYKEVTDDPEYSMSLLSLK